MTRGPKDESGTGLAVLKGMQDIGWDAKARLNPPRSPIGLNIGCYMAPNRGLSDYLSPDGRKFTKRFT